MRSLTNDRASANRDAILLTARPRKIFAKVFAKIARRRETGGSRKWRKTAAMRSPRCSPGRRREVLCLLTRRDPHDFNGLPITVGGALLARGDCERVGAHQARSTRNSDAGSTPVTSR
jgi:hypothetical protein